MTNPTQSERPSRVWYWPAWQMTHWWHVKVWRGGDEYDRATLAVQLGPLGTFIFATGRPGSANWRCECGDLNGDSEAFCFRCGAGQPEEGD